MMQLPVLNDAPRFVVAYSHVQPVTLAVDLACLHLRQSNLSYAVLSVAGAFVNNINIAENILLMCTWNTFENKVSLLQRARAVFASWVVPSMDLEAVWRQRPFELNEVEVRVMALLRAALYRPTALVIAPDWFQSANYLNAYWWELQRREFRQVSWYLVANGANERPPDEKWMPVEMDTSGRLHEH